MTKASEGLLPIPAHQLHGQAEFSGLLGGALIRDLQSAPNLQRERGGTCELCSPPGSEASLDPGFLLPFHPTPSLERPLPAPKPKRPGQSSPPIRPPNSRPIRGPIREPFRYQPRAAAPPTPVGPRGPLPSPWKRKQPIGAAASAPPRRGGLRRA